MNKKSKEQEQTEPLSPHLRANAGRDALLVGRDYTETKKTNIWLNFSLVVLVSLGIVFSEKIGKIANQFDLPQVLENVKTNQKGGELNE